MDNIKTFPYYLNWKTVGEKPHTECLDLETKFYFVAF